MQRIIPIESGWMFKNTSEPDSSFMPVAQFPTAIHLDLIKHGKIPDPFLDTNEAAVQWVGEEVWIYRTLFPAPQGLSSDIKVELVFDGLDTYATVSLNSMEILKTENMFIQYHIDITDKLKETNILDLRFDSTWLVGKKLEKEAKDKLLFCHNGDSSRLQVRKAQYHYGWDWGPTLLTRGPWRPVYLDCFLARVSDLTVKCGLSASLSEATIDVLAQIDGLRNGKIEFELFDPDHNLIQKEGTELQDAVSEISFHLGNPQLWYPAGYGSQPLYTVKASLLSDSGHLLCTSSKRIGLRRVELIQRPLKTAPGTSFFFQINGIPIFSRGADWIPADSFLPRVSQDKYCAWVRFTAKGNHNMIRVWGGGVFEDESFYAACDECGIMVWQDFMLGCGAYPVTPAFLAQIEKEAIFNIKRLHHHPSVVLWCGNNEDNMFADRYPSGYDPDDLNPDHWLKTRWPARIIYDKILPEICAKYIPETPYHPGSPWGGRPSNDPAVGDIHSRSVWMNALEMYPYLRTLISCITDPSERHPQSRTLDARGKSASKTPWAGDFRNIALYMFENLRHGYSLPLYVYASQLVQAEAMTFAYVSWRRLWRGEGREECAGALCWQLNDCWPCVSWSLGDYNLRPKLAYYTIKRALTPLAVGVAREEIETGRRDEFTRVHVYKETRLQVWASNFTTSKANVDLHLQAFEVSTGACLWECRQKAASLAANQSTELIDIPFPTPPQSRGTTIVAAQLLDPANGTTIARFADWPQPLRHIPLPKPTINLIVDGDLVRVSADLPVKGLQLMLQDDGDGEDEIEWDDNCIDLMPGDEQIIHARGLAGRKVRLLHLAIAADD
ncbi:hypothetical protein VTN77DRAFT_9290 [Rasamsonia byssochlamydoides]|uniref:uncharacterized protein n=1 Tax=Rasamsonia byssochlamydoides TaxID=89139 RepID=UPI0037434C75